MRARVGVAFPPRGVTVMSIAAPFCPERHAHAGPGGLDLPEGTPIDRRSIFTDCIHEADRFKWIESEKAGRDLGEGAIKNWVQHHWWGYLRARWLEHLQGNTFWMELDRGDFGLLRRDFTGHRDLLDQIVDLLKDGQENLGVIAWATRCRLDIDPVIQILEALDINSRRLVHQFDCAR